VIHHVDNLVLLSSQKLNGLRSGFNVGFIVSEFQFIFIGSVSDVVFSSIEPGVSIGHLVGDDGLAIDHDGMTVIRFGNESVFSAFGDSEPAHPFNGKVFKVDSIRGRFGHQVNVNVSVSLLHKCSLKVFIVEVEPFDSVSGSLRFVSKHALAVGGVRSHIGDFDFKFVNLVKKFLEFNVQFLPNFFV
jgi:hypothetical protein